MYNYPRLVLLAYNYEQVCSAGLVDPQVGSASSFPRLGLLAYNFEQVGSAGLVNPQDGSAGTIIQGWFC